MNVGIDQSYAFAVGKRGMDFALALLALLLLSPVLVVSMIVVRLADGGPALYWSTRIGRLGRPFEMPKLRTMRVGTPVVATDRLPDPVRQLTAIGPLLRKSSLDELPQLWSILVGQMSFVGPRPALFNQTNLIELRRQCGVDRLLPGLTGWAQVNGRDELGDAEKVRFDKEYLERACMRFDCRILLLTVLRVARRDGVAH
jgi:O-antigen biosynthesis protein WbqP